MSLRLRFRLARIVRGFLALLLLAGVAATVRPLSLFELIQKSEVIAHGKVRSLETARDEAGRTVTRVELDVDAVWKGAKTNRLSLAFEGGILGERRVTVLGQPNYRPEEEVVVFCVRSAAGFLVTVEMAQGKFVVARDGRGGVSVHNTFFGATPSGTPAGGYRPPYQLPLTLKDLQRQVEDNQ